MCTHTTSGLVLGSVGTHSPLHLESSGSLQTPFSDSIRPPLPNKSLGRSVIGPIVWLRLGLLSFLSHLAQLPEPASERRGLCLDASPGVTGVSCTGSRRRREAFLDCFLLVTRRPTGLFSVLSGGRSNSEQPK